MVRVYVLMCVRVSNTRVLLVIFTEITTSSFCVLMFAYVLMCVCVLTIFLDPHEEHEATEHFNKTATGDSSTCTIMAGLALDCLLFSYSSCQSSWTHTKNTRRLNISTKPQQATAALAQSWLGWLWTVFYPPTPPANLPGPTRRTRGD